VGKASGIKQTVFQKNGDLVRLAPGKAGKFGEVRSGRLLLDGDIISPADGEAMIMRRRIAFNGVVTVALAQSGKAKVAGLGLPLDEDYADFVAEAEADIFTSVGKMKAGERGDPAKRSEAARLAARRAAQRWSGKKPQVQVLMMDD
jgi:ribonuclease J